MKRIVVDLDGTITLADTSDYKNVLPNLDLIEQLRKYKRDGFEVVIATARNMRTYEGSVGKINLHTIPTILEWLDRHDVPCDELLVGKPWCGYDGFYVDDKAVRPSEFISMTLEEITELIAKENVCS